MSFLDSVKDKISNTLSSRRGADEEYYDDYGELEEYDDDYDGTYDDGYEDGYGSDGTQDNYALGSSRASGSRSRSGQSSSRSNSLRTPRLSYQLDNHSPLISTSDVRSQGVEELQQSGRRYGAQSASPSYSRASSPQAGADSNLSQSGRNPSLGYGSDPSELRGDTPEFYASRSGQVKARATTGGFATQSFRQLVVVRPASYADAEKVAAGLKEGHAIALDLRNTRPELAKRILDFSFGAASALGGQVEMPANRVYAITIGVALTKDEQELLAARGVA